MKLPRLTICGLGPGGDGDLTEATAAALDSSGRCFLRTIRHPTAHRVPLPTTFDEIYDSGTSLSQVYETIAERLVQAAVDHDDVVYVVPGSPLVLERSVAHLRADSRVEVDLVPSLSFLDVAWARLGIDPVEDSIRLVDGHVFESAVSDDRGPMLIAHTHARWVLSEIKLAIDAGPEQKAIVLKGLGTENEEIFEVAWPELDRSFEPDHLTSLYVPEVVGSISDELGRGVELMRRLRNECPWDQRQTHASLRRYLLEETYEVLEALDGVIASADTASRSSSAVYEVSDGYADLEEELGDLWFQILFHAELASEAGAFNMADVARAVHDKLVARHPHVFGGAGGSDVEPSSELIVASWESSKQEEKNRESIMDGVPSALPALAFAQKILEKADRYGDRADPAQVAAIADARMLESVGEQELGSLLLALVERARCLGLDPENALRQAAGDAKKRFRQGEIAGTVSNNWVFG